MLGKVRSDKPNIMDKSEAIPSHQGLGWQIQWSTKKIHVQQTTFWSLLQAHDHHQKIMPYNVVKENGIIYHPRLEWSALHISVYVW
jgi:hypothetical protein